MSGMAKNQLDSGIAGSLYQDISKLKESIVRVYPQLKKARNELEFGYKVAFDGIPEDEPTTPVKPKEMKGFLDGVRGMFGN